MPLLSRPAARSADQLPCPSHAAALLSRKLPCLPAATASQSAAATATTLLPGNPKFVLPRSQLPRATELSGSATELSRTSYSATELSCASSSTTELSGSATSPKLPRASW